MLAAVRGHQRSLSRPSPISKSLHVQRSHSQPLPQPPFLKTQIATNKHTLSLPSHHIHAVALPSALVAIGNVQSAAPYGVPTIIPLRTYTVDHSKASTFTSTSSNPQHTRTTQEAEPQPTPTQPQPELQQQYQQDQHQQQEQQQHSEKTYIFNPSSGTGLLSDAALEELVRSRSRLFWQHYLVLLAVNLVIYALWLYGNSDQYELLSDHFELSAESAYHRPWTLLTSSLSHNDPLDLAVNMLGMLVLGHPIFIAKGPVAFWALYGLGQLYGALADVSFNLYLKTLVHNGVPILMDDPYYAGTGAATALGLSFLGHSTLAVPESLGLLLLYFFPDLVKMAPADWPIIADIKKEDKREYLNPAHIGGAVAGTSYLALLGLQKLLSPVGAKIVGRLGGLLGLAGAAGAYAKFYFDYDTQIATFGKQFRAHANKQTDETRKRELLYTAGVTLKDYTALAQLGQMYYNGLGGTPRFDEARYYLSLAARRAPPSDTKDAAKFSLAVMDYHGHAGPVNYSKALKTFNKLAAEDHVGAQHYLGLMNYYGQGVAANKEEARKYFSKSAERQNPDIDSVMFLGLMCVEGEGGAADYGTAKRLFEFAAQKKEPFAEYSMGRLYKEGKGVEENPAEARKWFELAAAQNFPQAQFHLGMMYYLGEGGPKNTTKATDLMKKASDAGLPEAADVLKKHLVK